MNWTETKKMLDVLSGKIINEFKKYIYIHGAYPDNIEDYEEKQAEDDAKYFLEMKLFSLNHPNVKYTNEEIDEIFGLDSDAAKDLIWRNNGAKLSKIESIKNYANKIIESNELVVKDNDYELFVQNVAEMLWKLSEKRKGVVDNFINNIDKTYEFSTETIKNHDATINNAVVDCKENQKTNLLELFDDFVHYKRKIEKSIQENQIISFREKFMLTYKILKYVMNCENSEIDIEDVTINDVNKLKFLIERYPKNAPKILPSYSVKDICSIIEGKNILTENNELINKFSDVMSPKTILNYSNPIRNCVNYAVTKKQLLKNNVFSHFSYNISKKSKKESEGKPFTSEELKIIFNNEIFSKKQFDKNYKFWVPTLLLYTGARLNEICNLKITDVISVDKVLCVNVSKSKTEAGIRVVPLHSSILKIGFLKFVEFKRKNCSEYLFDELKEYNSKSTGRLIERGNCVGKWFNIKSGKDSHVGFLNKCNIFEKGKKLHSFRNTFINNLKQEGAQLEEIKEIVGHVSNDITFSTYAQPYEVKVLKKVVEKIDYSKAMLPWNTNKHYHELKFHWEK